MVYVGGSPNGPSWKFLGTAGASLITSQKPFMTLNQNTIFVKILKANATCATDAHKKQCIKPVDCVSDAMADSNCSS